MTGNVAPPGPHAVRTVTAGSNTRAACYDGNGNQLRGWNFTADRVRDLTWTSYDRVKTVIEAGRTLTFAYGATRERFRQIDSGGPTTIYIDGLYEREALGALTTHVHHVFAGGQAVAIYKSRSDSTEDMLYLHRDHLGSVTQLTRVTGGTPTVVESLAYDPWGKRRNSNWLDSTTATGTNTKRGYTGHEHLDPATLVHLNGRVAPWRITLYFRPPST